VVLVGHWRKKQAKMGLLRWMALAVIVKCQPGKKLKGGVQLKGEQYRLKWITQGPNHADVPDSTTSRAIHRRYLARPPSDVPVSQLKDLLNMDMGQIYEVEALMARRYLPEQKEWELFVRWKGFPLDQCTWEPRCVGVSAGYAYQ
jgi:hypothetical protein